MQLIGFAITGVLAGTLAGLLGIGGGLVTIPCLLFIFSRADIAPSMLMHLAIGTSLSAMVFNTLSASYSHKRKKGVLFAAVKPMLLGIAVGALLGVTIARMLSSQFLEILFGAFECLVGIRFLIPKKEHYVDTANLPPFWALSGIGFGVATFSTMLGIGGGILNVPILHHFKVPLKKAIGTASALSFCITTFGAIYYLFLGFNAPETSYSMGYIYLPAFFLVAVFALCFAPLGVKLAHRLPAGVLKKIFGVALVVIGLSMIL
ncbi:sulfite exporter TauE/SafE family protein [Candidatus Neptunochlamydia vexilliferae]|nr:sulfite exporter TauE/SafE family protein [Candidatus Neptunochlamydia vexilliferae]